MQRKLIKLVTASTLVLLSTQPTAFSQTNTATAPAAQPPHVVGDLRLHDFHSEVFGNTRKLRVLLPPGYTQRVNSHRRYPVLYLNDGQNLFDATVSVFNPHEWQVDETVDRLTRAGEIEPIIIVGIDNAGRSGRANELLPYPDAFLSPPLPNPQGAKYPEFLIDEVIPFVNKHYRTKTGAAHTGLGGSSYGALAALFAVTARPGRFGRLLIESPSLYVNDGEIFKTRPGVRGWPRRVYLGVGTNEGGRPDCKPGDLNKEAVTDVLRLEQLLKRAGLDNSRLKVVVEDCAIHSERAWAKRFPAALKFLYRRR